MSVSLRPSRQTYKNAVKRKKNRGGKTILRSGQGWPLPTQLGQLNTLLGGKRSLLSYTSDLARLRDRLD